MEVGAIVSLRTYAEFAELFALSLIAQIEGVRELALVAALAEATLVVLAYQVAYTGALFFGYVVAIRAVAGVAGAFDVVLAYRSVDFGWCAEGADCWLVLEKVRESEGWCWC